jgi:hypothetical protein
MIYMIDAMNVINAALEEYYEAVGCTPVGDWVEPKKETQVKSKKDDERKLPPVSTWLWPGATEASKRLVCEGWACGFLPAFTAS